MRNFTLLRQTKFKYQPNENEKSLRGAQTLHAGCSKATDRGCGTAKI